MLPVQRRVRTLGVLLLAGCTDTGDVADYTLSLVPVTANNQAPFAELDKLDLVLVPQAGDRLRYTLGAPGSGSSTTIEDLPALAGTVIEVEGYADNELVSWGRTEAITATTGDVETSVLVAETDAAAWLGDVADGVVRGMLAHAGGGTFVLAGGHANTRTGQPTKVSDAVWTLSLAPPSDPPAFVAAGVLPSYEDGSGDAHTVRIGASFTPLTASGPDQGSLLLVGGAADHPYIGSGSPTVTSAVSLYDPATGAWTDLPVNDGLVEERVLHVAHENLQGDIVVWGGWGWTGQTTQISWVGTAEVYDRATRAFTTAGTSTEVGTLGAAITDLGTDGTLVCGGASFVDYPTWSSVDACLRVSVDGTSLTEDVRLPDQLAGHAMVTLADGRVLVTGGVSEPGQDLTESGLAPSVADAWTYDPASGGWSAAGRMNLARAGHAMAVLPDGRVVVAGGAQSWNPVFPGTDPLSCIEVFDPATTRFTMLGGCTASDDAGGLPGRAVDPMIAVDPERGALVVGGIDAAGSAAVGAALYVPTP